MWSAPTWVRPPRGRTVMRHDSTPSPATTPAGRYRPLLPVSHLRRSPPPYRSPTSACRHRGRRPLRSHPRLHPPPQRRPRPPPPARATWHSQATCLPPALTCPGATSRPDPCRRRLHRRDPLTRAIITSTTFAGAKSDQRRAEQDRQSILAQEVVREPHGRLSQCVGAGRRVLGDEAPVTRSRPDTMQRGLVSGPNSTRGPQPRPARSCRRKACRTTSARSAAGDICRIARSVVASATRPGWMARGRSVQPESVSRAVRDPPPASALVWRARPP